MKKQKRSYVGEMEWALDEINVAHNDRNPNRAAQINAAVKFGLAVAVARRNKEPLPLRPDMKKVM